MNDLFNDPFSIMLSRDPRQEKVTEWLYQHGKSDLHELTWEEIGQALAYAGIESPLAKHVSGETDTNE